ncbi:hypothetical protein TNCT_386921 [Trichonephila clavata]|uniref:Uncharacterized protein n=1 Tax=Trichonephila clavata TaxID=2740835 RepID=A0A8X6KJX8_TRICU|nr:hypothetical protein TNCT_386921 [Trichonephila clavata]
MRLKQIKDDTEKHSALVPLRIKRSEKIDSANSSWKMRILFDFHFLKRKLTSSEVFRKSSSQELQLQLPIHNTDQDPKNSSSNSQFTTQIKLPSTPAPTRNLLQIKLPRTPAPTLNSQQIKILRTSAPTRNSQQIKLPRTPAPTLNSQQIKILRTPAPTRN